MADVPGKPVHQLAGGGYTDSIGTALLGVHHLGTAAATDHRPPSRAVHDPDPAHRARYDELGAVSTDDRWRTRPFVHRLARRS